MKMSEVAVFNTGDSKFALEPVFLLIHQRPTLILQILEKGSDELEASNSQRISS